MSKGYAEILEGFRQEGRHRVLPQNDVPERFNLSDNDYLGIAASYTLTAELAGKPASASASRLLATRQEDARALEELLASLYHRPVRLFNSGYHANVGALSALAIPGTLVISDKLNHASIIDGIRLSGADCVRFRHNDFSQVRRILDKNHGKYDRFLIVTESVFSMDGDFAPLRELCALKEGREDILLYVDEAHGFGVYGEKGEGLCAVLGLAEQVDVLIGTFGKAAASMGAFVAASPLLIDFLTNTARSLIFSTSLPPLCHAITRDILVNHIMPGSNLRKNLHRISGKFREGVEALTGEVNPSQSHIVPLMIGDASEAVRLSAQLREKGILALPIRRPTVPAGTERIRFSLNALLTDDDIAEILRILKETLASRNSC